MRTVLLALALFAAACGGSKKQPQSPAPEATEAAEEERDGETRDQAIPEDADDPMPTSADPCDGGE